MAASFTPKPLLRGAVPTSAPSIGSPNYTVPTGSVTTVRAMDFTNTSGSNLTVTVWLVASGAGSVATSAAYLYTATIIPNLPPGSDQRIAIMSAGDMIFWQASGSGINGYISGAEEALS